MKYQNEDCGRGGVLAQGLTCAEVAKPEPSIRDMALEIRAKADEIFHRSAAINGFVVNANRVKQTEEKTAEPRCLRDELVYTHGRMDEIIGELSFLERKLGLM